jgi:hypothetical protein
MSTDGHDQVAGVPARYSLVQNDRRAVYEQTQAYLGLTYSVI